MVADLRAAVKTLRLPLRYPVGGAILDADGRRVCIPQEGSDERITALVAAANALPELLDERDRLRKFAERAIGYPCWGVVPSSTLCTCMPCVARRLLGEDTTGGEGGKGADAGAKDG